MKIWITISILILLKAQIKTQNSDTLKNQNLEILQDQFNNWIVEHSKIYTSEHEYRYRFNNFLHSKAKIQSHNSEKSSYQLGLTKFSDLSDEEYMSLFTPIQNLKHIWKKSWFSSILYLISDFFKVQNIQNTKKVDKSPSYDDLPVKSIDWEKDGYLNPIQDQRICGGCYAFAAIAASEAAYKIKYGKEKKASFSEQFIIDCGWESDLSLLGCMGGLPSATEKFLLREGLVDSDSYPYISQLGVCDRNVKPIARVKEIKDLISNSYDILKEVIEGPVSVFIEWTAEMKDYRANVFDINYPCGFAQNHAVTVVGFDLTAEVPYMKIRNSHGIGWGDDGYIKMRIRDPDQAGLCGIGSIGAFRPIIE